MEINKHLQTAIATAITALAMYAVGVQPAQTAKSTAVAESEEYAANSQMIRDELKACLTRLETCWRNCGGH